tara:strand:- start:8 stop:190 length:183 start_codon:yes stop_codon:yes gene_type:complete
MSIAKQGNPDVMTPFDSNFGAAQHTYLQIQLSRNNNLKAFGVFVLQKAGHLRIVKYLTMF